jgi:hypothetical protein
MDSEGLSFFRQSLNSADCYLEFGCGGSTVYACNEAKVRTVISVDTDPMWVEHVKKECPSERSARQDETTLHLLHVDLGPVENWGTPKDNNRARDFWKYSTSPWEMAARENAVPDVVLIDGRFRVACFLYSLLAARKGTLIIFDDYLDRPEYFVAEKYCQLEGKAGRMGFFFVSKNFDTVSLVADYAKYSLNSD